MPRARRVIALALSLAAGTLLVEASAAQGDGLPVVNLDTTRTGIEDPASGARYYALGSGRGTRVVRVASIAAEGAESLDYANLPGRLAVPGVAFDGTTSGLSADGGTLVLIEPRVSFPRPDTKLVVLDSKRLDRRATVTLEGDFSFDAISPGGETIYLIHYLSQRDPTRYEVRAYDIAEQRLLAEPIIDRRTAPGVMRGYPITRATSPDGVWAYTLYDGGPGREATPFVHALNTAEGTALCIDLEMLGGNERGLSSFGLAPSPDGESVEVLRRGGASIASLETGSWSASAATPNATVAEPESGDGSRPPVWIGLLCAAALGGGLLALRARRRRGGAPDVDLPADPFGTGDPNPGRAGEKLRPSIASPSSEGPVHDFPSSSTQRSGGSGREAEHSAGVT